jgi:hypothetical protein
MVYRFKTKTSAEVLMTQTVGKDILTILDKEPSAEGVIQYHQIDRALMVLQEALRANADNARTTGDQAVGNNVSDSLPEDVADPIALRQRAWPLMQLMEQALIQKEDVYWGP